MKVFLSWSGDRSKALAGALREWLPLVLHYVEPWMSNADIDAGDRWAQSVANELAASNFGIVCLTSDNRNSPWILFEAGALAKSLEISRVIPVLLDLEYSDISGPLAQFQAKKVSESGLTEIITSIQSTVEAPIPAENVTRLFGALWADFENKIEAIPAQTQEAKRTRPQVEVLEELVAGVRSVESKVRDSEELISRISRDRPRGRRSRMRHEMMFDFSMQALDGPDDPAMILMMAGYFRDDFPWVYELALEAYRAMTTKRKDASRALSRFERALHVAMRGPFMEEFPEDREAYMMLREMSSRMSRLLPHSEAKEN